MKKSLIIIAVTSFLMSCSSDDSNNLPTEEIPAPVTPVLDHSGLEPLSAENIDNLEYKAGGDATLFVSNNDAFSTRPEMIANNFAHDSHFTQGDHLFRTPHDNIGPLLSTGTCQGCHLNDGRGVLPSSSSAAMTSMLFKLADMTGKADPIYGDQLQPFAEQSFTSNDFESGFAQYLGSANGNELYGEAFPFIEYEFIQGSYDDGTSYELRKPIYKVKDLSFGDFTEGIQFSPRLAPQVFGVGLLEAIPTENILKLVDADDANNDGISGRASMVTEAFTGETKLGRFAYKAQNPTVLQQVAGAYNGDIGITTSMFSNENCTQAQIACLTRAEQETKVGSETDLQDIDLALVEFYNRVLGVPARRGFDESNETWNSDVTAGRKLFFETGCIGCHTPRHVTAEAKGSQLGEITIVGLEQDAEPIDMLSEQVIFPYTDLLLHDMGGACEVTREDSTGLMCAQGEQCFYVQRCEGLADGVIQGDASGTEWKTPPLWGLGLVQVVNPNSTFLHDGRARTIEEAILWHGGEAQQSADRFKSLSADERTQILKFLQSL